MNEKLKPCPFCGSTDVRMRIINHKYGIFCADCESCGPLAPMDWSAVEYWNRRRNGQQTGTMRMDKFYAHNLVDIGLFMQARGIYKSQVMSIAVERHADMLCYVLRYMTAEPEWVPTTLESEDAKTE